MDFENIAHLAYLLVDKCLGKTRRSIQKVKGARSPCAPAPTPLNVLTYFNDALHFQAI